jgi:glycine/D-amino acid oxidase-like deaminating enzyme/nitrite reductase/ring-hydroxylating ferredoxin subunit
MPARAQTLSIVAMNKIQGQSSSIWDNVSIPMHPPLMSDTSAEVCIVGAGIAGITTAYLLARAGKSVIVLDDSAVGAGETGRTTAHLSFEIDDRIAMIERLHGADAARLAVESHMAAVNHIEQLVTLEQISCEFERLDGYLIRGPDGDPSELDREYDAAHRAGISDAQWVTKAPMDGFDTGPCIRFPNQGMFHPLKYLDALARAVTRLGGRIHCQTRVDEKHEEGPPARVYTKNGHIVTADAVVVATNAPAINFLEVQTKQTAMRTYAIAVAVPRGSIGRALIWDTSHPYHYVRLHSDPLADYDCLIVGGEDHKTGQDDDPDHHYQALEEWTRARFSTAGEVKRRWSGQVIEPIDKLAFIGRYDKGARNFYCITSDSGQGMTHSTIGAMLISDQILGRDNPWVDLYSPARKTLGAAGEFLSEQGNNISQYTDWVTPGEVESSDEVAPGEGAIMRRGIRKLAVYRDPGGTVHELSAACTHLGCIVKWNTNEHTWDCPCHGSRFNPVGRVLNGPAVDDLRPVTDGKRTHSR